MKKIISLFIGLFSVVLLVGCSNSTSTSISDSKLDGKYHSYTKSIDYLDPDAEVIIEGKTLEHYDGVENVTKFIYSIDTEKQVLIGNDEMLPYSFKDGVLEFDGSVFLREDSKEYKKLLDDKKD